MVCLYGAWAEGWECNEYTSLGVVANVLAGVFASNNLRMFSLVEGPQTPRITSQSPTSLSLTANCLVIELD